MKLHNGLSIRRLHDYSQPIQTHIYLGKARRTPFVINELIQIHDYLEAFTFAFFIKLKTAC